MNLENYSGEKFYRLLVKSSGLKNPSFRKLGEKYNVSRMTIFYWKNNMRSPNLKTLSKILSQIKSEKHA